MPDHLVTKAIEPYLWRPDCGVIIEGPDAGLRKMDSHSWPRARSVKNLTVSPSATMASRYDISSGNLKRRSRHQVCYLLAVI